MMMVTGDTDIDTDATRDFRLFIPISKSVQMEDGRIIHHGLATDESLDLEDDAIPTDFFQKSVPYLSQWGKFNWNHGGTEIGDVMQARIVTPEEARKLLGPDVEVVNKAMYVRGDVYPIVDPAIASDDLKKGHHALLAEAKLGYSVEGVAIRRGGKMQGAFASKIAITHQPTNLNTVCVMAKSLGEIFTEMPGDEKRPIEVVYPEVTGELEVLVKSLEDTDEGAMVTVSLELWNALIRKTLEAGSGPGVGSTGGRSLGRESLEGRRLHSPTLGGRAADRKRRGKKKKRRNKKKRKKGNKDKKRFPRLSASRRKAGKKRAE